MTTCRDIRDLLTEYFESGLAFGPRVGYRLHLLTQPISFPTKNGNHHDCLMR